MKRDSLFDQRLFYADLNGWREQSERRRRRPRQRKKGPRAAVRT